MKQIQNKIKCLKIDGNIRENVPFSPPIFRQICVILHLKNVNFMIAGNLNRTTVVLAECSHAKERSVSWVETGQSTVSELGFSLALLS